MSVNTLPTPKLSDVMYVPLDVVHQWTAKPDLEAVLPPPARKGDARYFNERQSLLMMLTGDLVRSGRKFPQAAKWACRIAEELLFHPEAPCVHVEFRRNGAMFFFTSDDAPEAAEHAGPRRFRMTFDLDAYRAAIRTAMSEVGDPTPGMIREAASSPLVGTPLVRRQKLQIVTARELIEGGGMLDLPEPIQVTRAASPRRRTRTAARDLRQLSLPLVVQGGLKGPDVAEGQLFLDPRVRAEG